LKQESSSKTGNPPSDGKKSTSHVVEKVNATTTTVTETAAIAVAASSPPSSSPPPPTTTTTTTEASASTTTEVGAIAAVVAEKEATHSSTTEIISSHSGIISPAVAFVSTDQFRSEEKYEALTPPISSPVIAKLEEEASSILIPLETTTQTNIEAIAETSPSYMNHKHIEAILLESKKKRAALKIKAVSSFHPTHHLTHSEEGETDHANDSQPQNPKPNSTLDFFASLLRID
jgi:hypothetical protein